MSSLCATSVRGQWRRRALALTLERVYSTRVRRPQKTVDCAAGFVRRRYSATATAPAHRPTPSRWRQSQSAPSSSRQQSDYLDDDPSFSTSDSSDAYSSGSTRARIPYPKQRPRADPAPLQAHLHALFPPLEFPPALAVQMLTHISAKEAWAGHNARLSFLGRRVLQSYLHLFLASASLSPSRTSIPPQSEVDLDRIAYTTLFTPVLGEHVGRAWGLARVMLWTAPLPSSLSVPLAQRLADAARGANAGVRGAGLYKVQGTTVEGVMGGVFHQFGGPTALRVFHTRVLPHLLLPGTPHGLPGAFHARALELAERMGGQKGLLAEETSGKRSRTENEGDGSERQ